MAFGKKLKRGSGDVPELGAIFMSNRATKEMCFSWKTFGLPYSKANFVKQVKAGMFLFLFEHETRKLYGVYQACSDGAVNFSSDAFSSAGNKYPAQVKFKVLWYCKPLSEYEFRPAIKDNYFAAYKFKFGLSRNQVRELLWLFNSRKLRDELLRKEVLPVDPSLIRGATRSPSIDDAEERFTAGIQNQNVLENANALEQNKDIEKFSIPNSEVRGRLLIEDDRDNALQDKAIQVREMMDYGCKPNNDYELNSGVPYNTSDEGYDPDAPLLNHMTATQHQQIFYEDGRFMWDGRVYTDNAVDGRTLFKEDEIESITRQIHVSSEMHHDACDNSLNPLSYYCNSIPKVGKEMVVNLISQPSATCYFEPVTANSRSPCPAYIDNAVDEGPTLYNPDSGTSLQGRERCSEVHLNPDFFRDSNNSISAEIDDASILRQPVTHYNSSHTISHPISSGHFQIGVGIESFGTKLHEDALLRSSRACGLVDVNQASKVSKERQSIPPNKRSVFSRLKPALDADDECKLKDPQKNIDDMVNVVMETLKGHYCQLVRESNSTMKQVSDGEDKSKFKKRQTLQSEAAKYVPVASTETVFYVSTSNTNYETQTEREINGEIPCINFKRRSEVHKTCNAAEGEVSSAILAEKQCKRRKLVRPSFSDQLSNKDGMVDKISENLSLSCQPIQDGSFNPDDKGQNLSDSGNSGFLVLATSVEGECSNGLLRSSNLINGSADISMGSESEKHQGQSLSNPSAWDAQHLAKQCNLGSAAVDVSFGGKISRQSTLNRENSEGAELSWAFSANDKKDGYTMLKNTSFELPPKGVLDHVKDIFNKNELGGSLKDPVDIESINCTLQLNLNRTGDEIEETFMMFNAGHKKPGDAVCCDLNAEVKSDAEGVSTKMELGGALKVAADFCVDAGVEGHEQQYAFVAEVRDNQSGKSVGLDGSQHELPGRDEVHEEATFNNLLAEGISSSCQASEVRYFEFLTK